MVDARFLLDANCCIALIEKESKQLRERAEQCSPGELVTSAVAFAEVAVGVDWSDEEAASLVSDFFSVVPVLPFDRDSGRAYANIPFARHRFDRLLAAHALSLGLTLVTSNVRDFRDIRELRVEDWSK